MRVWLMAGAAAMLGSGTALAQDRIATPPPIVKPALPGPAPTLVLTGNVRGVRSESSLSKTLAVEVLNLEVRIRGNVAETRLTATFRNDGADVLEGDFAFDMPAGSVITGYALDVGPDMIDGVLAGRDRAREAYQRRVVQRVDPGLAEVSYADRFSTRIFPIPARGSRTIRLVMTSPVDPVAGYVLPLRPSGPVGRLVMAIASDDGTPPAARLPTGVTGRWQGGALAVDAWNVTLGGELRLPTPHRTSALVISRHANGERFFEIDEAADMAGSESRAAPPVHVFWDRSASHGDDDVAAERALIAAHLAATGARVSALTLFDSGGAVTSQPATAAALDAVLRDVTVGGGTSFAVLADVPVEAGALCLLVSDGRATLDSRAAFALPCRTFAITAAREVDRGWLAHVVDRSGGALIELASTTRSAALAALAQRSAAPGQVTDAAGHRLDAVRLPAPDGRVRLIGPMPDAGELRLLRDGRIVGRYPQSGTDAPVFSGTGALWASRRIAAASGELRTADLVDLSRRYSVASPLASFIVLENAADYVEANIPPPASYPKRLREAYAALSAETQRQRAQAQTERLDQVVALWADQRAWWAQRFDQPPKTAPQPIPRRGRDTEARDQDRPLPSVPVSPPLTSPPPPAVPAVPPAAGDIVVTGGRTEPVSQSTSMAVTTVSNETLDRAAPAGELTDVAQDGLTGTAAATGAPAITIAEWSPGRPWIVAIDAAGANWATEAERQRHIHGALPIFWFDLAEWHFRHGRAAEARRAVEAALDLPVRDNQTLSIVAARLERYGGMDRAIALVEQLADREDERPQPLRTLAVLLMHRAETHRLAGRTAAARADLTRAIALLADAVLTVRRENARGFETVALMDANLAVARLRALGGTDHALPPRLVALLDADIRVVVEWNTPRTDIDLWTEQPNGEDVGFSHPMSAAGGKLSGDVTTGYGPEEFLQRRAIGGTYVIRTNTYASDLSNPNGPSTVAARIIRNFGRPNQSEQIVDVEMAADDNGRVLVGRVVIPQTRR